MTLPNKDLIKCEIAKRGMLQFAQYMRPSYLMNWHHVYLATMLDLFFKGVIKRLMVFMPPQHGKSEFTSRLFPAYCLGQNPDKKIILASYAASLAEKMNRDCQKVIDSEEYAKVFPQTKLQGTNSNGKYVRNAEVFDIVDHDGYLKTVGVGGGVTGNPADLFIIDDPHKDRKEAQSPQISNGIWDWYTDAMNTRLHNDSGVLLIQTRWAHDDLAGRILQNMNDAIERGDEDVEMWTVITLPAICTHLDNPDDPRKIGEALWPVRHSLRRLNIIRSMSLRTFQSLYQQDPQPVQAGGEAYKTFDYNTNCGEYTYNPDIPLHFSFDFNVNPHMTCGVWQIVKEVIGQRVVYHACLIAELCLRSPDNTTKAICRRLREQYGAKHRSIVYVYGDPAGKREDTRMEKGKNDYTIIMQELANFKVGLRVMSKAPAVEMRIQFMCALFADNVDTVKIHLDKRCQKHVDDFLYIKEESDGTKQKQKAIDPVTGINCEKWGHASDETEYFICAAFAGQYGLFQTGGKGVAMTVRPRVSKYKY